MQFIIQMQDLGTLTFGQFCNRDAGPSGNDSCDLFVCYTVMYQRQIFAFYLFLFNLQLFLKFRQFAVLQLCCFVQIIASLCFFDLFVHIFNLFTQHGQIFNRMFFVIPLSFFACKRFTLFCQLLLQVFQTLGT